MFHLFICENINKKFIFMMNPWKTFLGPVFLGVFIGYFWNQLFSKKELQHLEKQIEKASQLVDTLNQKILLLQETLDKHDNDFEH